MEDFLGGGYMICSTQLNNQQSICKRMAMEHNYMIPFCIPLNQILKQQ